MRLVPSRLAALTAAALLLGSGCSKTNNIDTSNDVTAVGSECGSAGDAPCQGEALCVLSYCRQPCRVDLDCADDAACVGEDEFGCSLPWELGCSSAQPCDDPLSCDPNGEIGVCRNACDDDQDCGLPDYGCVDGVCVP